MCRFEWRVGFGGGAGVGSARGFVSDIAHHRCGVHLPNIAWRLVVGAFHVEVLARVRHQRLAYVVGVRVRVFRTLDLFFEHHINKRFGGVKTMAKKAKRQEPEQESEDDNVGDIEDDVE